MVSSVDKFKELAQNMEKDLKNGASDKKLREDISALYLASDQLTPALNALLTGLNQAANFSGETCNRGKMSQLLHLIEPKV